MSTVLPDGYDGESVYGFQKYSDCIVIIMFKDFENKNNIIPESTNNYCFLKVHMFTMIIKCS